MQQQGQPQQQDRSGPQMEAQQVDQKQGMYQQMHPQQMQMSQQPEQQHHMQGDTFQSSHQMDQSRVCGS